MIQLQHLSVRQGDFALSNINLLVPTGAYGILMGPTACGKTTMLEAICGLRPIYDGTILLDETDVTALRPAARGIGYVPQDAALFPAMRIDRQIGFSMRLRGAKKQDRIERINELAELLEIPHLLDRKPVGLSGGERQRVALARALAFRPRLLCLDEPLSAVDEQTKERLMELLKRVQQHEHVTALHVTHSSSEAKQLGTNCFRVEDGQIKLES